MKCPKCGEPLTKNEIGSLMASIRTPLKDKASRENGKLGGRPKKQEGQETLIGDKSGLKVVAATNRP